MCGLPSPLRVAPSRGVGIKSQARRPHRRQNHVIKSTLSGVPWRNNGACRVDESAYEQVLKWVESYGGYVHPSLGIGYSVATGSRGIIAKSDVSESDLKCGPLIAVPDCLRINAATSQLRLRPLVDQCGLPALEKFPDRIQTSLLLAFEKKKGGKKLEMAVLSAGGMDVGVESFWSAYIETLPEVPSCAWLLPENDLRIEIALLPSHMTESGDCLERAKFHAEGYKQDIEEAIEDYGDAFGLEVEDLTWAVGQIHSRSYGEDCSLIPIVDLINHHAQAMPPLCLMSDDSVPMTYVGSFYYGMPRALATGSELFVNYCFPKDVLPLALFLDYGFLPQELMKDESPVIHSNGNGHDLTLRKVEDEQSTQPRV